MIACNPAGLDQSIVSSAKAVPQCSPCVSALSPISPSLSNSSHCFLSTSLYPLPEASRADCLRRRTCTATANRYSFDLQAAFGDIKMTKRKASKGNTNKKDSTPSKGSATVRTKKPTTTSLSTKKLTPKVQKSVAKTKVATIKKHRLKNASSAKSTKSISRRGRVTENVPQTESSPIRSKSPIRRSAKDKSHEKEARRITSDEANQNILPSSSALTYRELASTQRQRTRRNTSTLSPTKPNEEQIRYHTENCNSSVDEDRNKEDGKNYVENSMLPETGEGQSRTEEREDEYVDVQSEELLVEDTETENGQLNKSEMYDSLDKYELSEDSISKTQTHLSSTQNQSEESPPLLQPEVHYQTIVDEQQEVEVEEIGREIREEPTERSGEDVRQFQLTGEQFRVQTPNGSVRTMRLARDELGNEVYVDEDNQILEIVIDEEEVGTSAPNTVGVQDQILMREESNVGGAELPGQQDLRTIEFNFLDAKNVCCGLCGEIVPYELLVGEHLPQMHPDTFSEGTRFDYEEVPYDQQQWLQSKLEKQSESLSNGFRTLDSFRQNNRTFRRISQIRVNPYQMSLLELENALKKKMLEKMGREVPVSLVDKLHARCGICNAIISLNKKFETVHIIRHFNAWHPAEHRCAGTWKNRPQMANGGKPLNIDDFTVVDISLDATDNLQCVWCGCFTDRSTLAQHFTEAHPTEIQLPKCTLCLHEVVMNARMREKFNEDMEIELPDEFHVATKKFGFSASSEKALERLIERRLMQQVAKSASDNMASTSKVEPSGNTPNESTERVKKTVITSRGIRRRELLEDDNDLEEESEGADNEKLILGNNTPYVNSRHQFGRKNRMKRCFVQPCFRQVCPVSSAYVIAISECEWRCKLCNDTIYGAVISAGAIRHYKNYHPGEVEAMQYELCKARLARISAGYMEFVHPQLVECLICHMTYALHKPYNMCRGIRHLKQKHPDLMPEYNCTPINRVAQNNTPPNLQAI